eukprot:10638075-Alexandrium_andersonii.AAC.1
MAMLNQARPQTYACVSRRRSASGLAICADAIGFPVLDARNACHTLLTGSNAGSPGTDPARASAPQATMYMHVALSLLPRPRPSGASSLQATRGQD